MRRDTEDPLGHCPTHTTVSGPVTDPEVAVEVPQTLVPADDLRSPRTSPSRLEWPLLHSRSTSGRAEGWPLPASHPRPLGWRMLSRLTLFFFFFFQETGAHPHEAGASPAMSALPSRSLSRITHLKFSIYTLCFPSTHLLYSIHTHLHNTHSFRTHGLGVAPCHRPGTLHVSTADESWLSQTQPDTLTSTGPTPVTKLILNFSASY